VKLQDGFRQDSVLGIVYTKFSGHFHFDPNQNNISPILREAQTICSNSCTKKLAGLHGKIWVLRACQHLQILVGMSVNVMYKLGNVN